MTMTVTVRRAFIRTLVEMVTPEGADEALIETRMGERVAWEVRFNHLNNVFEFFVALGLMTGDDELEENHELAIMADDARELAQRAVVRSGVGHVVVFFPDVELAGE